MKKLVLKRVGVRGRNIRFRIKEQTHRGGSFGVTSGSFIAKDVTLESRSFPQWFQKEKALYVRGEDTGLDDHEVTVGPKNWKLIQEAVKEYNKAFGDHTAPKQTLPPAEPKRHLELEAISMDEKHVNFKIAMQTHRENGFAGGIEAEFNASNGVGICSYDFPEWEQNTRKLFVIGSNREEDDNIMGVKRGDWNQICAAVDEYNEYFNDEFLESLSLTPNDEADVDKTTDESVKPVQAGREKQLLLRMTSNSSTHVDFKIDVQTHRKSQFGGDDENTFVASNGFALVSSSFPERKLENNILYVRGTNSSLDNNIMRAKKEDWKQICAAVVEYNKYLYGEAKLVKNEDNVETVPLEVENTRRLLEIEEKRKVAVAFFDGEECELQRSDGEWVTLTSKILANAIARPSIIEKGIRIKTKLGIWTADEVPVGALLRRTKSPGHVDMIITRYGMAFYIMEVDSKQLVTYSPRDICERYDEWCYPHEQFTGGWKQCGKEPDEG